MENAIHIICPSCEAKNRLSPERLQEQAICGKCKNPLLDVPVRDLDSAAFERLLHHSDLPLVVDFWAPWCGPCQAMAPAFAEVAKTFRGKAILVKVNTDQEQALSARFAIRSIPTLAVFKGGQEIARQAGAGGQAQLQQWIQQQL